MGKSRTKNSIMNLVAGFGGQIVLVFLKFLCRTVFIQTLGKSYLGINGLFSDILTMLSLTELGFDTAINFRLYKPLAEDDDKRIRMLMKFYKNAYRVVGLTIFVLGLCLIPALKFLIKDYDNLAVLGINAALIFMMYVTHSATSYLAWAYRAAIIKADQKNYIIELTNMLFTGMMNVTQIIILYVWKDFILYTLMVIVFDILKNMFNGYMAKRMYPKYFGPEEDSLSKEEVIKMFKDCGALFIYKINNVVTKATDNTILSAFLGLGWVALYSNYLLFYQTIRTFLNKFYSACKASMGNLYATSDISKSYAFFCVMNYLSVILFGTACVGVAVEANEMIVNWIGEEYLIAQPFSILMGIELLFLGIQFNLGQVRNISGVFRQMWWRPLLGIIVNLVVSVALVQVWGIYGVLIGTIASNVFTNFLVDPVVIHKHSFNNYRPASDYYKRNLQYFGVLTIVCILDFMICNTFLTGMGVFSLLVHIAICGISVPAAFVGIYWKSDECQYLMRTAKNLIKRRKRKKVKTA